MEQRTDAWYEIRRGRFTASEIVKLIGTGAKPSKFGTTLDAWTDTAATYILGKVAETFSEQDHELKSVALTWGTEQEPIAKKHYEAAFGETIEDVGFIIWKDNDGAGASPDGIVAGKPRLIEVKSPYTLKAHIESFLINSNAEFKAYKPEYYWQVQMQLLVTQNLGMEACDFVSFHPFFQPDKRITSIEILPDKEAFEILAERIHAAVLVRDKLIEQIING